MRRCCTLPIEVLLDNLIEQCLLGLASIVVPCARAQFRLVQLPRIESRQTHMAAQVTNPRRSTAACRPSEPAGGGVPA